VKRSLAFCALILAACSSSPSGSGDAKKLSDRNLETAIVVQSTSFAADAPIPQEYSCNGANVSPPLTWSGVPSAAKALAVVVDDPDARNGPFVHWVLFNVDASLSSLDRGTVPTGARQAKNSAGKPAYTGPCPPSGDGPHHYRFTVYARRAPVTLADGASSGEALDAILAAATAKGTLVGTFAR
jgi:Raf kinase inhibitor-like YbhB/YbcL family protein